MEVRLEEGGGGGHGVHLGPEHAVEQLRRGGGEERAVPKRGGDARLRVRVELGDGRVERAGGGVDPREELRVERGAHAAERGVRGARVRGGVACERGVCGGGDGRRDGGREGGGLVRDAGLDGAQGEELDADEEDAGEADGEAGERGRVEDEREEPGEAVARRGGEVGGARGGIEDAPGKGVLHLDAEREEGAPGELERAGVVAPAGADGLGGAREAAVLEPDEERVPEDDEDGAGDEDADADVRDAGEVAREGVDEGHVHAAAELDGVDGGDGEGDVADLAGGLGERRVHLRADGVEGDADELVEAAAELVERRERAVERNHLLLEGVWDLKISYLGDVEAGEGGWIEGADWVRAWCACNAGETDLGYTVDSAVGGVDDGVGGGYSTSSCLVGGIYAPLDAICYATCDGPEILLGATCSLDDKSECATKEELEEA